MITERGNNSSPLTTWSAQMPVQADTRGRLRVTAVQRRELVAAFVASGESLPHFARRLGLKYSTVARWVQLRRGKGRARTPRLQLVEAVVDTPPASAGPALVLHLPGGVRTEVATPRQLTLAAQLIHSLARPC
ncbi:MAG TPA: helix-turn-helix domain-containing protein [Verrucomicrobiae bacterium]